MNGIRRDGARRSGRVLARAGLGLAALLSVTAQTGQGPTRPSDGTLRAITQEGRRIASYHEAIAAARMRLEQATDLGSNIRAVVIERGGAWHVVFITLETRGDVAKGWVLWADAVFAPRAGEVTKLDVFDPPKPASEDAQAALRAIEAARGAAKAHLAVAPPPFNEAIFREKSGVFTVYLQSNTGSRAASRFGADLKAKVSKDGQVLEIEPLHGPGESVDVRPGDGKSPTLHSHTHGDLPTGTDVALVIESPRLAPHLVMTPAWILRIESDGALTWLGRNEVPPAAPGGGM